MESPVAGPIWMPSGWWSWRTRYTYGLPDPVETYLSGRDPPARSREYTDPPLRSTPPMMSWTQYGKYRRPARMFAVSVAQDSTGIGVFRFSLYSSTSAGMYRASCCRAPTRPAVVRPRVVSGF